jgi:hypothetical protein
MKSTNMITIGGAALWLAVLGSFGISARDAGQSKYTVKVPGGLAFSEFKGYEAWQTISISRNERVVAAIRGNPVIRGETARLAEPLGLRQVVIGPPKLRLGALQIVDIR